MTSPSELNQPNEQDKIDAERYRWLVNRINQGLLTLYDTTAGPAKPWVSTELEETIDKGVRLEQLLNSIK